MRKPYFLLSSKEIIENQNEAIYNYSEYSEWSDVDDKITNKTEEIKWLHFSNCSNNGGTSQIFIDFSPSKKGKVGQIVRFLHDPNEFEVIADSFDTYLKKLMNKEYDFIKEGRLD